jgi:threonine/homoserine/homoserine lactone efflux protein
MIKSAGALYLIYSGYTILLAKPQPLNISTEMASVKNLLIPRFKAFREGFFCNVLNPKVTLFFLSLSSILITPLQMASSPVLPALYAIEMFAITLLWFSGIAVLISTEQFNRWFKKIHIPFLRTIGILFILLGIGLMILKLN